MAPSSGTLRVRGYFIALLLILGLLYLIVFWPGAGHTPKLGLDLQGGAQVTYQAKTIEGKAPTRDQLNEARAIMETRVNAVGVEQSEVVLQGNDQLVISIPGKRASDLENLGNAAKMNLRAAVMPPVARQAQPGASTSPAASPTGTTAPASSTPKSPAASSSPTPSASVQRRVLPHPLAAAPTPSPTPTPSSTPSPSASGAAEAPKDPLAALGFAAPKTYDEYAKLTQAQKDKLNAVLSSFDCKSDVPDDKAKPLVACDDKNKPSVTYLLGPVIVEGTEIKNASAVPPNAQQGQTEWTVSLEFKGTGTKQWADYTKAHHFDSSGQFPSITECGPTRSCAEWVAFTLDGLVVSAPHNEAEINGLATQISGSFTQASANDLARKLKYGALPVNFQLLNLATVSATLGPAQLKAGLIAGGIGLVLVVIYSLIYYRALGLVTIASLLVSATLTYACLVILGHEVGFTLTLAGIAGFIVAIGITADSFVVFFERIKDEVHSGRSVRVAIPRAWERARRTILSADTVSFLAAGVLYYFAGGDVRGFAFTLGMSTILDVLVVFLFTHPVVAWLSRFKNFGSGRMSGLQAAARSPRVVRERVGTLGGSTSEPVPEAADEAETDVETASEATAGSGELVSAADRAAARRARLRSKTEES